MKRKNPKRTGRPVGRFVTTVKKEPTKVRRIPVSILKEVDFMVYQAKREFLDNQATQ